MASEILTHTIDALARLPYEHKGKTNIVLSLSTLVDQVQELETAWHDLFTDRGIDSAVGQQLTDLGAIVGESRQGRSDDDYRRYIRGRIAANNSEGRISDIIRVTRIVLNDSDISIEVEPQYPASLVVRLVDGLGVGVLDAEAETVASFMRDTAAGGVRIQVHYLPVGADNTFTLGYIGLLNGPGSPTVNAGSLYLDIGSDVELLPDSGFITIEPGTGNEETVEYHSKDSDYLYLVSATTLNHFALLSEVKIADSTTLGLGDSVTPTNGGYFSSVIEGA